MNDHNFYLTDEKTEAQEKFINFKLLSTAVGI